MAITPTIPKPSHSKVNVVWLDVNTLLDVNIGKPDLLPNEDAISNSLYNLFRCPVGARGPIFQPRYGSALVGLLHEPMDYITANKIKMYSIQAIQKWEPRIILDLAKSRVDPDDIANGYKVTVVYTLVATNQPKTSSFLLSRV